MVSHTFKFIFVHIPKTAGTSFEEAFGHFEGFSGRGGQDHRTMRDFQPLSLRLVLQHGHRNLRDFAKRGLHLIRKPSHKQNQITVNQLQYDDYFKFTVVRNPWARVFSWYKNVVRDEIHRVKMGVDPDISLKDFLTKHPDNWGLHSQMHWLRDMQGDLPFDYIARFETLHQDFETICERLGCAGKVELPHRIKGGGADYRDAYDSESVDLVAKRYQEEIKLLGYEYEGE